MNNAEHMGSFGHDAGVSGGTSGGTSDPLGDGNLAARMAPRLPVSLRLDVDGYLQDAAADAEAFLADLHTGQADYSTDAGWAIQDACQSLMTAVARARSEHLALHAAIEPLGPTQFERL